MKKIKYVAWLFPFVTFYLFALAFPPFNKSLVAWICLVPYFVYLYYARNIFGLIILPFLAACIPCIYGYGGFAYYSPVDTVFAIMVIASTIIPFALLQKLLMKGSFRIGGVQGNVCFALSTAALWVFFDFVRASLPIIKTITGGILGYSQCYVPCILKSAHMFGAWGITFFIVLINAGLFILIKPLLPGEKRDFKTPIGIIGLSILFFVLGGVGVNDEGRATLTVGIIQPLQESAPVFTPEEKHKQEDAMFETVDRLSQNFQEKNIDLVVMPERLFVVHQQTDIGKRLASQIAKTGIPTLVGVTRVPDYDNTYNTALLYNAQGEIEWSYDKRALFPYSEYIPGVEWIDKIVTETGAYKKFNLGNQEHMLTFSFEDYVGLYGLTPGRVASRFFLGDKTIGAAFICLEDLIESYARESARKGGAQFFVVITNDGWFRESPTVEHHLLGSIMRAVENGVSVVRAANTGISAIILPSGRVASYIEDKDGTRIDVAGTLIGTIPLTDGKTFYNGVGFMFPYLCAVMALICIIMSIVVLIGKKKEA